MKKFILVLTLAAIGGTISAQDLILKKDASEIPAKVTKVGDREIEYKKWNAPEGPIYVIPTRKVESITYRNGSKDMIAPQRYKWKYQGEVAIAYGLDFEAGSVVSIETIHGFRINSYLFTGLGTGCGYIHLDENAYVPLFVDVKGYYPLTGKSAIYLALDLGTVTPISDFELGYYTAFGPGISLGKQEGVRGDLGIRFQHMGEGMNAVLFRIGVNF